MLCAIHQPNFFPWVGYFDKISRADVFVFLNQVDYEKSGHSMQCYTNRVAVLAHNGEKKYVYCPVIREHGPQRIDRVMIKPDVSWKQDLIDTLERCYKTAPFYSEVKPVVDDILDFETESISEFNIHAIMRLCDALAIGKTFVRQDELNTSKHSTELLVEITKATGCDQYMYGGGGSKYQEDRIFEESNIKAVPQNFTQRSYKQGALDDFVGGLSILDPLFWTGVENTIKLFNS